MIDSRIWESPQVSSLKPIERLLYVGMITIADDEGRLRGDGPYLRRQIFYGDKRGPANIERMRDRIQQVGLIDVYSTEKGTCISHPNWNKYQTPDKWKAKKSDLPPPPLPGSSPELPETPSQRKLKEENGTEDKASDHREKMLNGMNTETKNRFSRKRDASINSSTQSPS